MVLTAECSRLCVEMYAAWLLNPVDMHAMQAQGFIRVCHGRFVDSKGKMWTFAGWNGCGSMGQHYLVFRTQ